MPRLLDYEVRIPPGGKTDALVEATITWDTKGKSLVTTGIDSDQLVAAVLVVSEASPVLSPVSRRPGWPPPPPPWSGRERAHS